MAFKLQDVGGYGTGALGDVTNPTGQINSYANVTMIDKNTVTIGTPINGVYETFIVGKEIVLYVSVRTVGIDAKYLGSYVLATITAVTGSILTLNKDVSGFLPLAELVNHHVQAITVAQFNKLTLTVGNIFPLAYNVANKYGGVLAIKCRTELVLSGGNINLVDKGIPIANIALRPLTEQEKQGTLDTDKYSGWENHITVRQLLLNCGDGIAMLYAKAFTNTAGTTTRIGGTTAGVQFGRGNAGGSTIMLVSDTITGFVPDMISKKKGTGQGLGRCYIASKTKLRNDEGLYAYDGISDPTKLMKSLNIKNFGDGSLGAMSSVSVQMNNYARVVNFTADGKTIYYINKTTVGLAKITQGSLIMFHVSKHIDSADMSSLGKFVLFKVLVDTGEKLIIDKSLNDFFDIDKLGKYNCQIVSVAQFTNLSTSSNKATPAWDETSKIGGICAIAVTGSFTSTGNITVGFKKGGNAYGREGLAFIGNAQMADILPLGQGLGSVFILANNIKLGSCIGAYNTKGSKFGGMYQDKPENYGGYTGLSTYDKQNQFNNTFTSASGAIGACYTPSSGVLTTGGYGSNGYSADTTGVKDGLQGTHVFIVADVLIDFTIDNISTGGLCSQSDLVDRLDACGGAGYGGTGFSRMGSTTGGFNGGGLGVPDSGVSNGGGSSGWAFIYCNKLETPNYTGVVI